MLVDMDETSWDQLLESLCQRGCTEVTQLIQQLKQGELPTELQKLTKQQQQQLEKELSEVMQVYDIKKH